MAGNPAITMRRELLPFRSNGLGRLGLATTSRALRQRFCRQRRLRHQSRSGARQQSRQNARTQAEAAATAPGLPLARSAMRSLE